MDRIVLMGKLTRSPNVRYTQGKRSMAIARYTLVIDKRDHRGQDNSAEQQTVDFINCVAFDRATEFAEKYFRQGVRVLVSGRVQTGSYVDQESRKVYTTDIVLDDQESANGKRASGRSPEQRQVQGADIGEGFTSIPGGIGDEELPFS